MVTSTTTLTNALFVLKGVDVSLLRIVSKLVINIGTNDTRVNKGLIGCALIIFIDSNGLVPIIGTISISFF